MSAARLAIALAAATLGACTTAAPIPADADAALSRPIALVPLPNGDFEAAALAGRDCPASWWCAMHADVTSFSFAAVTESGSRGRFLKVTRVKAEPWALASQAVPIADVRGKRLRVSASVQTSALEGKAGPVIMMQGSDGRAIGDAKSLLSRGTGWTRAMVEIDVPSNAAIVEVSLYMEGGGWAGFDDVQVAVVPAAGN